MKTPKGFSKMTIQEQELWLVSEFRKVSELQHNISRMLAKVRGGQIIKISDEITRPDEALLKS
jgi:hypothetical protein